jgi:hypothetical protein
MKHKAKQDVKEVLSRYIYKRISILKTTHCPGGENH